MHRRSVLGVLAAGAVILAAAFGWREVAPSPAPERPLARPRAVRPPARPRAVPVVRALPPAAPAAPIEAAPAGPAEIAIRAVAEYGGQGVVRCPVADALPDGPVTGLERARVEGGVLVAAVDEPHGDARVGLPDDGPAAPPLVVVRWWNAWPGETGACDVLPPEQVTVTGRVVDARGRPVPGAEVGNLLDGAVVAGPDGAFAVACWLGTHCPIGARAPGSLAWGPFTPVVADGPVDGVEIVLTEAPREDVRGWLAARVEEDRRLAAQPDPLQIALDEGDLPPEAAALVRAWQREERELRATHAALLAEARW